MRGPAVAVAAFLLFRSAPAIGQDLMQAVTQAGGPAAASLVGSAPAPPNPSLPTLAAYLDQLDAYIALLKLQRVRIQPTAGADPFVSRMAAELDAAVQELGQASADLRAGATLVNGSVDAVVAANRDVRRIVEGPITDALGKERDCAASVSRLAARMDAGDPTARAPSSDSAAAADLSQDKAPAVSAIQSQRQALEDLDNGPLRRAQDDLSQAGRRLEAAASQTAILAHAATIGTLHASAAAELGGAAPQGPNPSQLGIQRADQARGLAVSAARQVREKADAARVAAEGALSAALRADGQTMRAKQPNLDAASSVQSAHDRVLQDQRRWLAAAPTPDPGGTAERAAACSDAGSAMADGRTQANLPADPDAAAKAAVDDAAAKLKGEACDAEKLASRLVPWRDAGGGPSACGSVSAPSQGSGAQGVAAAPAAARGPAGPQAPPAMAPPPMGASGFPMSVMPPVMPASSSSDASQNGDQKKKTARGTTDGSAQVGSDTPQNLADPPPQGGPLGASGGN